MNKLSFKKLVCTLILSSLTLATTACSNAIDVNSMLGLPEKSVETSVKQIKLATLNFTDCMNKYYNGRIFKEEETLQDYFTITPNCTYSITGKTSSSAQENNDKYYASLKFDNAENQQKGSIIVNAPALGRITIVVSSNDKNDMGTASIRVNNSSYYFDANGEKQTIRISVNDSKKLSISADCAVDVWQISYDPNPSTNYLPFDDFFS